MVKLLFLQDIENSSLFELIKCSYQLEPSINTKRKSLLDTKRIKFLLSLLNMGSITPEETGCPDLFVQSNKQFQLSWTFLNEQKQNDELGQFKAIKEFIFKHEVLFYDSSSFDIINQRYWLNYLDYKTLHQESVKTIGNLLTFLVLNKQGMALFGDKELLSKIKPLVQEGLKDRKYYTILHDLLIMSLANTKSTQFLLDCGLNPNYKNKDGLTPLMIATNTGVAKALIKAGADVHIKNEIMASHEQILGLTHRSPRYKSILSKNVYEIHSTLSHNSIIKLLDDYLAKNNQQNVAYSTHFQQEYDNLKSHASTDKLIKAVKNNNSVIFDNLHEFTPIFYDDYKRINFIFFCTIENKARWLEKALSLVGKNELMQYTQRNNINGYLETAIYYKATESAMTLLKAGMYDKDAIRFNELINQTYDARLIQTFYDVVPDKVSFHHLLQSTHLELIEKWIHEDKHCDDDTFKLFCEGIADAMKFNTVPRDANKPPLNMSRVKSNIIDCLATIINMEADEKVKQSRLNLFVEKLTEHSNSIVSDELHKIMKSKIQRAIKYFPEKQSVLLENISENFPDLVTYFEEKSFNKVIQTPKNKKMTLEKEYSNTLEVIQVKIKKNKI